MAKIDADAHDEENAAEFADSGPVQEWKSVTSIHRLKFKVELFRCRSAMRF